MALVTMPRWCQGARVWGPSREVEGAVALAPGHPQGDEGGGGVEDAAAEHSAEHATEDGAVAQVIGELAAELGALTTTPRGTVALGTLQTVGTYLLPELVRAFKGRYPEVLPRLSEGTHEELEARVASWTCAS